MSVSAELIRETPLTHGKGAGALHIVHGLLSLDVGGLERIVLDLIRAGRAAGHRVSVVCVESPGELAADATALGADVVSLDKPPGRVAATVAKAATALSALRPDLLHTHQIGALWYLGQAARSIGRVPVIHSEHGNHVALAATLIRQWKTRLFMHRAARFADRFCCVSEDIAQTVTGWRTVPSTKVDVILNGIRTDLFEDRSEALPVRQELGIPAQAPVIGSVGRLSAVKQQEILIRAAAGLRERFPEVRLLLVGDGPERSRLEREAITLGIQDRVHFAGYQGKPERYLHAMNLFALTSRSEGLPVSLLEAWAAGLPVVCSAVGGIPKVVSNGEDGLLFPNGDEGALLLALTKILDDRAFAGRLGAAGLKTVKEKYSLKRMANDYEQRYRTLLASRPESNSCASW
jgi:glycosyltransferase involved in cell wall biosynthesis